MVKKPVEYLSKREKQIMDVVYRRKKATVADVCKDIEDIPNYVAARVLMHLLEEKGLLRHERHGRRYVYYPTVSPGKMRREELSHLMHTFFENSPKEVMADLIELSRKQIDDTEWDEIFKMIEEVRTKGR